MFRRTYLPALDTRLFLSFRKLLARLVPVWFESESYHTSQKVRYQFGELKYMGLWD
jgi:hypothetical protein